MSEHCFDIGTIQAFLDGETSPEISARLTDHAADCDICALALADAEDQNSLVFSALEREMNTLVPTQRLWSRINESIEIEKRSTPAWRKVLAAVSAQLRNPSFATAFGVLLIAGMFAVVWNFRQTSTAVPSPGPTVASAPSAALSNAPSSEVAGVLGKDDTVGTSSAQTIQAVTESKLSPRELSKLAVKVSQPVGRTQFTPQHAVIREPLNSAGYLPGEESYVKTISELRQNVDSKKDTVLSPSSRIAYERDMAVVDDSIKKMKKVVRTNPNNQAARQVLYSSYQDKIDLLNSVAQREELMASIR